MNPFGAKDLAALAATLSTVAPSARDALIATAPNYQSEIREELAEYGVAAPLATDVIDTLIAAGDFNAPASGPKAAGLTSGAAPLGKSRTSEGCQDDLASVQGLTVALCRARDQSETASRARRHLLAGAHRDLRDPLTALLRLNSDWDVRGTDMVAVRMIEQQRQALKVMGDLIDGFLMIAEPEIARQPALLTNLASRSAGGKLREASPTPAPRAQEWSAERSMIFGVDRPEVPVAVGSVSRARRVLLIDEDLEVLGALRIYLLCAGYWVLGAANADAALDRARMARMATSPIDIIIANLELTGDDDGLAVIEKTRLLLGYNVPAVLLTTQTSIEIGKPALVADVSLLRNPLNLDELKALIGEVLKRPRRSRLAHLRTQAQSSVTTNPTQR
jgi:ActR/RegA family two-component response regulator